MQTKATNKISWEYWNDKEKELCKIDEPEEDGDDVEFLSEKENQLSSVLFSQNSDDVIITPFFPIKKSSVFKPSDRWECWIGYTNFRIDESFLKFLNKQVDGVSCLNVLDPYCFAIGVGKLFTFDFVRLQIEKNIKGTHEISGSDRE